DCVFPPLPNMLPPAKVVKQKPVWTEPFQLKQSEQSKKLLESIHAGTQEEIRLRAAMMASVDEGVDMFFDALERTGQLERTLVLFLGDMTYKAVRTDRHKYIHWVNRGRAGELDELYDLDKDPWELKNLIASPAHARTRASLRRELKRLVPEALDL